MKLAGVDHMGDSSTEEFEVRLDTSSTENVKGLFRLTFEIRSAASVKLNADVHLFEGEKLIGQAAGVSIGEPHFFAVNTHVLANGECSLQLQVRLGSHLLVRDVKLRVNNSSSLAYKVSQHLKSNGASFSSFDAIDSTFFPGESDHVLPWFHTVKTGQEIRSALHRWNVTDEEIANLEHFLKHGFIVVKNAIDEALLNECLKELDEAAGSGYQGYVKGSSQRLELLHEKYEGIRALWKYPKVARYLSLLFDEKPLPCQTLGFVHGSQQDLHQDAIHLTPYPRGYMCGVWVPLEDVRPQSGELMVVPGSHQLPRVLRRDVDCQPVKNGDWNEFGAKVVTAWESMVREAKMEPIPYFAQKGDMLIWHENLMHGGSIRADQSITRKSIVSHYFADGAIAYYDSTATVGSMASF